MANRFNANNNGNNPSGYNNLPATDYSIPPCGIEDVDVGMFDLFEKELKLSCGSASDKLKKVPVVFATGEKWALLKRNEPLRDNTNTLILPLIAITRTGFEQTPSGDIVGRGMNQIVGEIVIKRKLSEYDRGYQNLINRVLLKNQLSTAVNSGEISGQVTTGRTVGSLRSNDIEIEDGNLLKQNRLNNVYEIITAPTPQFFTATYEIMFWTQYTSEMNQLIETFMSSMLPWGMCWRIETHKGYWFVATLADGTFNNESNFQEVDGERIVKWRFNIRVPGFIFATNNPGAPVPIRRYVSAPVTSFDAPIDVIDTTSEGDVSDPHLGTDDPTLPLDVSGRNMRRVDMRNTNADLTYAPIRNDEPFSRDPALAAFPRGRKPKRYTVQEFVGPDGKRRVRYIPVRSVNSVGETVYMGDWDGVVVTVED